MESVAQLGSTGDYIKVTCETDTLTQYLVVHNGDSAIHMATHITEGSFACLNVRSVFPS